MRTKDATGRDVSSQVKRYSGEGTWRSQAKKQGYAIKENKASKTLQAHDPDDNNDLVGIWFYEGNGGWLKEYSKDEDDPRHRCKKCNKVLTEADDDRGKCSCGKMLDSAKDAEMKGKPLPKEIKRPGWYNFRVGTGEVLGGPYRTKEAARAESRISRGEEFEQISQAEIDAGRFQF